jgi:hypothetical protein
MNGQHEVFIMNLREFSLLAISLAIAFAVAGCGGGSSQSDAALMTTPTPTSESFTNWSKANVFAQPEDATPIVADTSDFTFDGDDDPNAYTDLAPVS